MYVYNPGREIQVGETLTFKFETDLAAYKAFSGQKISVTYEKITSLVTYILKPHYLKNEDSEEFEECYNSLEHIKTAEALIDIVSRNERDIFIDHRLDIYIAYYRWYLKEGKYDDVLRVITKITTLFDIMYDLYKEKALLYGSSEMFSSFERTFTKEQVDYMIHKLDMDIFEGYFESVKDSQIFKDYDRKLRYLMNSIYDVKYKSSIQTGVTEEMISMYEDAKKMLKEVDYSREYSALVLTTAEGRRYTLKTDIQEALRTSARSFRVCFLMEYSGISATLSPRGFTERAEINILSRQLSPFTRAIITNGAWLTFSV